MGTRHVGTLRGFGRFERRFNKSNIQAGSTYTEAGPRPGVPSARDGARVLAHISGAQVDDADVRIQRQGYPGPDSATAAYRIGAETSDDDLRGWNPPNVVRESAVVEWTTSNAFSVHDMTTLPISQRPVCFYADDDNEVWKTRTWSWQTKSWGAAVEPDTEGTVAVDNDLPCAIEAIAEDHLLAFAITGTATPGTAVLLRSSDQGATWRRVAEDVIDSDATWKPKAVLRYQPVSGQLMLVIPFEFSSGVWHLRQWASSDLGTFTHVADLAIDTDGVFTLEARPTGGFVVVYGEAGVVKQRRIGDAFDSFNRAPAETIDETNTVQELCSSKDADGKIWLVGRGLARPDRWFQWATVDGAASWQALEVSGHDTQRTGQYIENLSATHAMGAMWVNYSPYSLSTATVSGCLLTAVLGGWSGSTTNRATYSGDLLAGRQGSGHAPSGTLASGLTLLPYEVFVAFSGLTIATTGGGGTLTAADGRVSLVTTASEAHSFKVAPSPGSRPRWSGLAWCGATHPLSNWMRAWCKANNLAVYLRYDRAKFEIWDNDTSKVGATVSVDLTEPMWFELELGRSGSFVLTYRRPWETAVTVITGSVAGAAGAGAEIGWGCTVAQSTDSFYGPVIPTLHLLGANDTRFGLRTGAAVHGKGLGGEPYPIPDLAETTALGEVTHAARLHLTRGPAAGGDVIDIDAEHDYPIERIFPWDDPGLEEWRSQTDAAQQIIDLELAGGGTTGLGSTSILWPLIGVNFRTAYLERGDGSTWSAVATWDAATGFSGLTCAVDGDIVTPAAASAAAGRYVQQAELAAGYIETTAGVNRIARCEGGVWAGTGTTTKKVVLQVENNATTSASAGACTLWAHSGIVIVHNVGTSGHERYRIRIPAQDTAEGYFKAGLLAPCAFKPIGRQWNDDWTTSYQPQVQETGGGRRAHRREQLRPVARVVTISNTNSYLLHHLRGSDPSPNYLAADAGDPLEIAEAAPFVMAGLIKEVGGDPVILATSVPNTDAVITDPSLWMYGHMISSIGLDNVRGDEGVNERPRLQSVTFREITSALEESS